MALQREQIDTLLAEIDGVLSKANPRLPWVMSSEVTQQRQTLERIRHYLKGLQAEPLLTSLEPSGYRPWSEPVPTTNLEVSSGSLMEPANSPQAALNLSQQMMQAFTQDLAQLRSSLLQPLHAEAVRLQQQRDSLLQEIRQLERQRQQHTLIQQRASQEQQVYDFLQGLMDRLQERLSQQINQVVGTLAAQARAGDSALVLDSAQGVTPLFPQEVGLPPLAPAQRVEQLQMLQARADQVMTTLDTTLRAFAEALQQNIQSYESSLSQGLEKMHSMGQQGEAIVANLVQKLADQVSGQVLSGTLPSLPASPGSRLQGLNVQSTGSSLPPGQHFSTYASTDSNPSSGSNDRVTPRFSVPVNRSAKPLGTTTVPGITPPRKPVDPVAATRAVTDTRADSNTDANAELNNLDWDTTSAGLDLDLDLLQQLEQTTVESSSPDSSPGSETQSGEAQAGNEELDAFYASLFGDTPRKPEPIAPQPDPASEPELQFELESEFAADSQPEDSQPDNPQSEAELGLDLDFGVHTEAKGEITVSEETIALEDGDPFAQLGEDLAIESETPLEVDLLDLEPKAAASETFASSVSGLTSNEVPHNSNKRSDWVSEPPSIIQQPSMDPLAALSLELQTPFQGITELSPQRRDLDTSVTDPLMADLEEALQALGSPAFSPTEVTTTLTDGAKEGSKILASSPSYPQPVSPSQPEPEAIPPEDVITTLADVLPSGDWGSVAESTSRSNIPPDHPDNIALDNSTTNMPLRAEVALIPAPSPTREKDQGDQGKDLEDEIYHLAHPEEPLLVQDEGEDGAQMDLRLEPETLQQLTEDLSKLEVQPPSEVEDLFNFDRLDEEDGFGDRSSGDEDIFGEGFGDVAEFGDPADNTLGFSAEASEILEDVLEESSPEESLLPEDNSLDWLLEDSPRSEPRVSSVTPSGSSSVSFDLFANSAFERTLEEDLDLDSSFEEANELSLDRMTDWFGEADAESPSEELLLIDHLFADLPDAEKKNDDWNAWEP